MSDESQAIYKSQATRPKCAPPMSSSALPGMRFLTRSRAVPVLQRGAQCHQTSPRSLSNAALSIWTNGSPAHPGWTWDRRKGSGVILRPYQAAAIDAVRANWRAGATGCWLRRSGLESALHPDERVLMHDGTTKRSADVITGDLLQGPDGPRTVLSTTTGRGPLYRIVPVRGKAVGLQRCPCTDADPNRHEQSDRYPTDQFLKLGVRRRQS